MRGFERMTLANMRLNGVRSVIAACASCGRSPDVSVDLLPETLTVPDNRLRCSSCGVTRSRLDRLGTRADGAAFLAISANGHRCPRPPRRPPQARPSACSSQARPSPKDPRRPRN
jgi:hypothetical protein